MGWIVEAAENGIWFLVVLTFKNHLGLSTQYPHLSQPRGTNPILDPTYS